MRKQQDANRGAQATNKGKVKNLQVELQEKDGEIKRLCEEIARMDTAAKV